MNVVEAAELALNQTGPLSDPQTDLPRIARDPGLAAVIERSLLRVSTEQLLVLGDARTLADVPSNSVHLVLTSPPYWTLKRYRDAEGQLGHLADYEEFLLELDKAWAECFRVLAPGGRLICVVGDVCLSRRQNRGRHTVVPLHSSISEHCRRIGFDGLAPIIWHKIANVVLEATGSGGSFLGKPYEPNAVIKNDIEYVLMLRKPGGYRSPSIEARLLSVISAVNHRSWFQQIWTGISGASTKTHPAPFPAELAERLVRMFSFAGDTVLDPFVGSGTTLLAAARCGRNGIGIEIDRTYLEAATQRLREALPNEASLRLTNQSDLRAIDAA